MSIKNFLFRNNIETLVLFISLLLLLVLGFGESLNTDSRYKREGAYSLSESLKQSFESLLIAGLPLRQFVGFEQVVAPVLQTDPAISAIMVVDQNKAIVFSSSARNDLAAQEFSRARIQDNPDIYLLKESSGYYRLDIPLKSRFEEAGSIWLFIDKANIHQGIYQYFSWLLVAVFLLCLIFKTVLYFVEKYPILPFRRSTSIAFACSFLLLSGLMVFVLVNIYYEAISQKSRNLAYSISDRVSIIEQLRLQLDDVKNIDRMFESYLINNNEIITIALAVDGEPVLKTASKNYPGADSLTSSDILSYSHHKGSFNITLEVSKRVLYDQLWSGIKSFVVLFVASVFISLLFFNLQIYSKSNRIRASGQDAPQLAPATIGAGDEAKDTPPSHLPPPRLPQPASSPPAECSVAQDASSNRLDSRFSSANKNEMLLELIKPVFFIGVFVDALSASFLPQWLGESIGSGGGGGGTGTVSFIFTAFFVAYALILVPSARLCQSKGVKFCLLTAIIVTGAGTVLLAISSHYAALMGLRFVVGAAQGMLFIAVQLYILSLCSSDKSSTALATVVIQYYAGRISGTAIGALAYSYFGAYGVFLLGGLISLLLVLYISLLIPADKANSNSRQQEPAHSPFNWVEKLALIGKDSRFLRSAFIGINAKLLMIGVFGFSLPIVMDNLGFSKEDIGLVLMLYSGGVLLSTVYSSRLADRTGDPEKIVLSGFVVSALGLLLMGVAGFSQSPYPIVVAALFIGTAVLGLGHGYIAAPVVSSILKTEACKKLGHGESISMFRLFERVGNIMGPILLGYLLTLNESAVVFAWFAAFMLLSTLFMIRLPWRKVATGAVLIFIAGGCWLLWPPGAANASSGNTTAGISTAGNNTPPDWFKFSAQRSNAWTIETDPETPLRFHLTPATTSPRVTEGEKKIFVLIPKQSSAYPISLETVLRFFADRAFFPQITVANFLEKPALGQQKIAYALESGYDLIFAMGSSSVDFLFHHYPDIPVPVVSICAKDPVEMGYLENHEASSGNQFAYTSLNITIEHQMFYLKRFVEELRHIGVLYEENNESAYLTQAVPLMDYAGKVDIETLAVVVNPARARLELAERVAEAVKLMREKDPELNHSLFFITGSTSVFSNLDVVNKHAATVPVIGVSPSMVSSGENSASAAIGVGFEANAQLASLYALQIIEQRAKPGELKPGLIMPPDIALNFQRISKIGMKIDFDLLEAAGTIYDKHGELIKSQGVLLGR